MRIGKLETIGTNAVLGKKADVVEKVDNLDDRIIRKKSSKITEMASNVLEKE